MKKFKYIVLTSCLSLCMLAGFSQGVSTDSTSLSSPSINNSGTVTNEPYTHPDSNDPIGSDVTDNRTNNFETETATDNRPTDLNDSGTGIGKPADTGNANEPWYSATRNGRTGSRYEWERYANHNGFRINPAGRNGYNGNDRSWYAGDGYTGNTHALTIKTTIMKKTIP